MKGKLFYPKLIGFLFGFLLLFSVFIPITRAQDQTKEINLNGLWKLSSGATIVLNQTGMIIQGTVKESKITSLVGKPAMRGSLNGNSIKGELYLIANNRSCSSFDGFFPTTGTVSPDNNTITFTWENHLYNVETCKLTGEIRQGTLTYTRITPQDSPTPTPSPTVAPTITPQPTASSQADRNSNIIKEIPGYAQALIIEPPKESDFQKVSRSDFKQVNPVGTASATLKSATESANLTGITFIGKIGGDGELILQLPDGKEVKLTDDKSAFEVERPSGFRFRDFNGSGKNFVIPKRHSYIEEVDCHILLEQERQDQEIIKRFGGITYASDWNVYDTFDIKPIGDCSYLNNGGPVRVLAEKGQVTFKTPGSAAVSANNADFGIGYDAKSAVSIFEVYNGSITVTSSTGNSKTISATYGSEIKQIEVDKDGIMSEKIAIPLSQWQAFLASKQEKKDEAKGNTLPVVGVVAILGLGGIVFFLYRTGKLLPLYRISSQKIAELLKKIRKEKKTD